MLVYTILYQNKLYGIQNICLFLDNLLFWKFFMGNLLVNSFQSQRAYFLELYRNIHTSNTDDMQFLNRDWFFTLLEIAIHSINCKKKCVLPTFKRWENLNNPINHCSPHFLCYFMFFENVLCFLIQTDRVGRLNQLNSLVKRSRVMAFMISSRYDSGLLYSDSI